MNPFLWFGEQEMCSGVQKCLNLAPIVIID